MAMPSAWKAWPSLRVPSHPWKKISSGSGAASGVCDSSEVLVPAEEREARPRPIGCEFDGKGAGVEEVAEPEVDQAQPPLRAVHARIATH